MAASLLRKSRFCLRALHRPVLQILRPSSDQFEYDFARTEVNIEMLSQEEDQIMYMESYSEVGFRLQSGVRVLGPCAVFPKSILSWNVKGVEDVDEKSVSLFTLLEPKLDLLIIGKGDRTSSIDPKVYLYLKSKNINVEILPTDQALATFNFLNSEKRYIAGAFIPPSYVHTERDEDAGMSAAVETKNIYETKYDYHDYDTSQDSTFAEVEKEFDKAKQKMKDILKSPKDKSE